MYNINMKKGLKTFLIYLGVLILAFLATVVFCAAFLFFYREGNIFGIQYIKRNELIYARENEDMSDIQKIEVYGNNFDINIKLYHGISDLAGVMSNKVFGYAKKSKAQASFTLEYDEVNKTAVFTVKEPKGWLNKSECYIEIALPSDLAENDIDLFAF